MAKAGTVNPATLLGDATRSADLRNRLLFLIGALIVYRIGTYIPVPGIDHITPLPPELQKVSSFAAGVAASAPDSALARRVIGFLASPETAQAIKDTGLEPVTNK